MKRQTRSKFNNKKTLVDGRLFDSKAEAWHYLELKIAQTDGLIRDLECQPRYTLKVGGMKVCDYIADFRYVDVPTGETVVADVKGVKTAVYQIKKKLMRAVHGIEITEVMG